MIEDEEMNLHHQIKDLQEQNRMLRDGFNALCLLVIDQAAKDNAITELTKKKELAEHHLKRLAPEQAKLIGLMD